MDHSQDWDVGAERKEDDDVQHMIDWLERVVMTSSTFTLGLSAFLGLLRRPRFKFYSQEVDASLLVPFLSPSIHRPRPGPSPDCPGPASSPWAQTSVGVSDLKETGPVPAVKRLLLSAQGLCLKWASTARAERQDRTFNELLRQIRVQFKPSFETLVVIYTHTFL